MGRSSKKPLVVGNYVLFDVVYQDGALTSNRKVPVELIGGIDGDEPARAHIEAQDCEIAARSGNPRGPIKTMTRTPARAAAK
ncbi:MAG: hypothetical protein FJX53_01745 [Alphaproteobacteria bacterium]|nr:hypothetical protein [Alphaproteobacteria bacterium]